MKREQDEAYQASLRQDRAKVGGVNNIASELISEVVCCCIAIEFQRVTQGSYGSWKTWKVLEFYYGIFQEWKVLEKGHWSWKVLEIC